MKYPCNLIRDILPLYIDDVCSAESKEIVTTHLKDCPACTAYLHEMMEAEHEITMPCDKENEVQKASSLRAVKKKIRRKQMLVAMGTMLALVVMFYAVVGICKHTTKVVSYENNLSVSMVDGNLVGRLYGSAYINLKSKTVVTQQGGQEQRYLFYALTDSVWYDIITSDAVFSEYLLCPKDKSANQIDRVYYYTGAYTDLESMQGAELESVIQQSQLLWEKESRKS